MFQSRETRAREKNIIDRDESTIERSSRQYTQQGNRWIILDDFANPSIGWKSCNTRESTEANVCNVGTRIQSVAEMLRTRAKFITKISSIILSCERDNTSCVISFFFYYRNIGKILLEFYNIVLF